MIVMPANSTGWFWHCLARETGKIGHLFSPGAQRGPWRWFPYALDNGAFSCWNSRENTFDEQKWSQTESEWKRLLFWAQAAPIKPRWAIVPDVPGNASGTIKKWPAFAHFVRSAGIPLAVAVQDGMTTEDVRRLDPLPDVISVGGSTEWKWSTVEQWCNDFKRVHLLRCNMPDRLQYLEDIGCESTDGTGWNRGNAKQTSGLEKWCRKSGKQVDFELWPYVCKKPKDNKAQVVFA